MELDNFFTRCGGLTSKINPNVFLERFEKLGGFKDSERLFYESFLAAKEVIEKFGFQHKGHSIAYGKRGDLNNYIEFVYKKGIFRDSMDVSIRDGDFYKNFILSRKRIMNRRDDLEIPMSETKLEGILDSVGLVLVPHMWEEKDEFEDTIQKYDILKGEYFSRE